MPTKKLILIVIDGLTPAMLEAAVERRPESALAFLMRNGDYGRATTVFPSLTPVCVSSLATGAYPDVHEIPHLVWYDRDERRIVEYGSSFSAVRRAGALRSLRDTIFTMNQRHLGRRAVTLYEALEDAGLVTAAINITCYRGRNAHAPLLPGVPIAYGPKRFFFYSLFESDATGAPIAVRSRAGGSIDAYAAAVGRWLVTRDGFDFLVFYLPDYDYASHAFGPGEAHEALARADDAVEELMGAAGGRDEFLERYAVVLCSDHGQSPVEEVARLQDAFAGFELLRRGGGYPELAVTTSNRAAMVYRLPACRNDVPELAARLDDEPSVDVVLYRDGEDAVVRREGEESRFTAADVAGGRPPSLLEHPDALERAWRALANPNAGELIVSAASGWEFADLAGRHHLGGGSHGSLTRGDSEVPMLTVGLPATPSRVVDVAPLALAHFGVELPPYAVAA